VRLIANHHLLSEDLFANRVAEATSGGAASPQVWAAIGALDEDTGDVLDEARSRISRSPATFGSDLAQALIEVSSPEAATVYRLTYAFSARTLRQAAGHEYDGAKGDDPDAYLAPPSPEQDSALTDFYALEGRGLRRAATALRLWQGRFEEARRGPAAEVRGAAVQRTVAFLDRYHREAAERRASYRPEPEERSRIAWGYPIAAIALVSIAAVVAIARSRKRRAPRSQRD
jgi:hypothetical protein